MPITRTTLQALTTQTGPFTGSAVDVSGITGDFTIKLRVDALTAGNSARLIFEESVDNFTTVIETGAGLNTATGLTSGPEGVTVSFKRRDFGSLSKIGAPNGKLRIRLAAIDGGSITYESWSET